MGGYTKNIGFVGSVSLLVTSITGPGIVAIPSVFQEAGWLIPTLMFILISVLTAIACLLVIEACSMFPENQTFERNVEFTVLVHQFYGRYWYYAMIALLYGSLQSINMASVVGSAQVFDNVIISVFNKTCGFGITPESGLFCVMEQGTGNSPFGSNMMLFTFGYVVAAAFIIPLTAMDLNDNILLQLISCVYNVLFFLTLLGQGFSKGFKTNKMPVIGKDQTGVVGNVLFNFAMANEIPSWVNVTHPRVSIHKCIWSTVAIACALYVFTGIIGGLVYEIDEDSNLLQAMISAPKSSTFESAWMWFIYVVFPVMTYATSIPIAMIVVKMNFVAAKICSPGLATVWAVYAPFILAIPLQTGDNITVFGSWSSVSFQAVCNFIAPFLIYLYMNRRHLEMAQSVLDELEFLDITAGIKKMSDEDDDFDYIYHLPHADPARIVLRDPFKKEKEKKEEALKDEPSGDGAGKLTKGQSISQMSTRSRRSIKEIRQMLDPGLLSGPRKRSNIQRKGGLAAGDGSTMNLSRVSIARSGMLGSRGQGSNMMLAGGGGLGGSRMIGSQYMGASRDHTMNVGGSNANLGTMNSSVSGMGSRQGSKQAGPTGYKRSAMDMYGRRGSVLPGSERRGSAIGSIRDSSAISNYDDNGLVNQQEMANMPPPFRALPRWVTQHIPTRHVAMFGLIVMIILIIQVLVFTFYHP